MARVFVVDPIDGTVAFIKGKPYFAVAVAGVGVRHGEPPKGCPGLLRQGLGADLPPLSGHLFPSFARAICNFGAPGSNLTRQSV